MFNHLTLYKENYPLFTSSSQISYLHLSFHWEVWSRYSLQCQWRQPQASRVAKAAAPYLLPSPRPGEGTGGKGAALLDHTSLTLILPQYLNPDLQTSSNASTSLQSMLKLPELTPDYPLQRIQGQRGQKWGQVGKKEEKKKERRNKHIITLQFGDPALPPGRWLPPGSSNNSIRSLNHPTSSDEHMPKMLRICWAAEPAHTHLFSSKFTSKATQPWILRGALTIWEASKGFPSIMEFLSLKVRYGCKCSPTFTTARWLVLQRIIFSRTQLETVKYL